MAFHTNSVTHRIGASKTILELPIEQTGQG